MHTEIERVDVPCLKWIKTVEVVYSWSLWFYPVTMTEFVAMFLTKVNGDSRDHNNQGDKHTMCVILYRKYN